jgi:sigma-B regulation protein RsbU (phosphoserine phosphatase)
MFVTFICVVFEPATGRLTLANAGHCRPLLLAAGQEPRWALDRLGTALGFEPGLQFERSELTLRPGDTLVLYSDGVTEAFDPQQECYGNERLLTDARALTASSATDITTTLLDKGSPFRRRLSAIGRYRDPEFENKWHTRQRRQTSRTGCR